MPTQSKDGLREQIVMSAFQQKMQTDQVIDSVFEQMSNAYDVKAQPTGSDAKNTVPTSFVQSIPKAELPEEARSLKQVMGMRPKFGFVAGPQVAEGKEKGIDLSRLEVFVNTWRVPFKLFNGRDPESNFKRWYIRAAQKTVVANQAVSELRDLFYHQAMFEGAAEILTDNQYWVNHDNADFQTAPLAKRLHPNWFFLGMTTPPTRSATYATDAANMTTALKAMAPSSIFDYAALCRFIRVLRKRCRKLGWKASGTEINHVIILSEYQAEQLTSDPDWKTLMSNAEVRGPENRAISSIIGVVLKALVLVDDRSPVYRLDDSSMLYLRPDTETTDAGILYYDGEQSVDRAVKGAAGSATGTCEMAFGGGAGALIHPQPMAMELNSDTFDYGFREGFCAEQIEGFQRADWIKKDGSTVFTPTSCVYSSATPALMA